MMMMMNDNNFPARHTIIWNKNNHVLGRCDYMYKHEPILYGWNSRHKFYGKGEHTKSVWDIAKPLKNDLHPTMKPVELVVNAIRNSSTTGQIVADMFLGSGTTLIAADKTNRICYGMELSDVYCDVIIKRWQDFTGKEATLESTGETFNFLNEN
jgi:DNA modification methylase